MQTASRLIAAIITTVIVLHCATIPNISMSLPAGTNPNRQRLVYGTDDVLFGSIEKQQEGKPFGKVLDAGTGMHSLRWIATLGEERGMTEFTCITADESMRRSVQGEVDALEVGHMGRVVIGNWFGNPPLSFQEEEFDVILADYLIGAMDGFSPYKQDLMIPKLMRYLKPGGRLYIVGLEPLPDSCEGDAKVICKVRQVRDACILLAGHRCYREYPVEWIVQQIAKIPELQLKDTMTYPILYRQQTIVNQINVGRSKFPFFPSPELADSMKKVLDDLERQARQATERAEGKRIKLGFDYIVTAEKVLEHVEQSNS